MALPGKITLKVSSFWSVPAFNWPTQAAIELLSKPPLSAQPTGTSLRR